MDKKLDVKDTAANPGGILARLWRKVIKDNNLTASIPYMVDRYLEESKELEEVGSKAAKRKTKNTLLQNILAKEMTWKVFVKLIMEYLGAVKLTVSVKVTFPNGKESVHSVTMVDNKISKLAKANKEDKEKK